MNKLQEQQLQELNEMQTEQRDGFVIDDLSGLTWTMRTMSALQAKIKEVEDIAAVEIARFEAWAKEETKRYQADLDHLSYKVRDYHARVLTNDPHAKSIKTAYGVVKSRFSDAAPEKVDEQALIAYAKANDVPVVEVVETEKLKWAELKKQLTVVEHEGELVVVDSNGEVVPGVTAKPATTKFTVEVKDV